MLPAAPLDETPRPKAVAAPRGTPGPVLSTAAEQPKKLSGQEESTYEFPTPPAPTETIPVAPKGDLPPPPPLFSIGTTPPPLPPAPSPVPAPALPTLAPPVDVEAKPAVLSTPALIVNTPVVATPSQSSPAPTIKIEKNDSGGNDLTSKLRSLYDHASQSYAAMDTYTLRMRRREVVAGKARPEELILAKFRRQPFSIYLKWVGEEGKSREVCYVQGQHEGVLHTLMAPGDLFLFAGKHFKCAPDSPLVKSNCRYPITDAGFGPVIARFGRLVAALDKGEIREGSAKLLGKVKRPEFDEPVEGVVQTLPANFESLFPGGGQRFWYFDANHGLPVLIVTLDHQGKEVEYYCHDRIQAPANLDDDDFNPYRLWKAAAK